MSDRLTDAQAEAMRIARRKLEREEARGLTVAQQAGLVAYVNGLERRLIDCSLENEALWEALAELVRLKELSGERDHWTEAEQIDYEIAKGDAWQAARAALAASPVDS